MNDQRLSCLRSKCFPFSLCFYCLYLQKAVLLFSIPPEIGIAPTHPSRQQMSTELPLRAQPQCHAQLLTQNEYPDSLMGKNAHVCLLSKCHSNTNTQINWHCGWWLFCPSCLSTPHSLCLQPFQVPKGPDARHRKTRF